MSARTNIEVKDETGYNFLNSYTGTGQFIYGPTTGPNAMLVVGRPGPNPLGNPVPALSYNCTNATAYPVGAKLANPYHPVAQFNGDIIVTGRIDPIGMVSGDDPLNSMAQDTTQGITLNTGASVMNGAGLTYNNLNGPAIAFNPQISNSYNPMQVSNINQNNLTAFNTGGISSFYFGSPDFPTHSTPYPGIVIEATSSNTADSVEAQLTFINSSSLTEVSILQTVYGTGQAQISALGPAQFFLGNISGTTTMFANGTTTSTWDGTNFFLNSLLIDANNTYGNPGQVFASQGNSAHPRWISGNGFTTNPNYFLSWDPNGHIHAGALVLDVASTVSSGTPIILNGGNSTIQEITGSSPQTVELPDCTTLSQGYPYLIINNSSAVVTVTDSSVATLFMIPAGKQELFTVQSNLVSSSWIFETSVMAGLSIITAGAPVSLDTTSNAIQVVTGSSDQTVLLPPNSFLGQQFQLKNDMAANIIDVQASDATTVAIIEPETGLVLTSIQANGTTFSNWLDF